MLHQHHHPNPTSYLLADTSVNRVGISFWTERQRTEAIQAGQMPALGHSSFGSAHQIQVPHVLQPPKDLLKALTSLQMRKKPGTQASWPLSRGGAGVGEWTSSTLAAPS